LEYGKYLSRLTIDLYSEFSHQVLKSKSSRDSYLGELNRLSDFLKKDPIMMTIEDCYSYLSHLDAKVNSNDLKESTRFKKFKSLRSIFEYFSHNASELPKTFYNFFEAAEAQYYVSDNIDTERVMTLDEFNQLSEYLLSNNQRDYCLIHLIFTGMFLLKDVLSLRRDSFVLDDEGDFGVEIIHNGFPVITKIPKPVVEIIKDYLQTRHDELIYLFLNKEQTAPLPDRTFQRYLNKYCKAAGLSKTYTPSDIRLSGIVTAFHGGATHEDVQKQLNIEKGLHVEKYQLIAKKVDVIGPSACDYIKIKVNPSK